MSVYEISSSYLTVEVCFCRGREHTDTLLVKQPLSSNGDWHQLSAIADVKANEVISVDATIVEPECTIIIRGYFGQFFFQISSCKDNFSNVHFYTCLSHLTFKLA